MTNYVHLLMAPKSHHSISRTIQYVGRHYLNYVNHLYGSSGTLWEGRHKGCVTSIDEYLLACMRYIALNPVRAGMVETAGEFRWTSYLQNVTVGSGGLVLPHPVYTSLGTDDTEMVQGVGVFEPPAPLNSC